MLENYGGTWTCRDMAGKILKIMLAHGHVEMWLENCRKIILAHGHDYYDKDVPKNRMKNQ